MGNICCDNKDTLSITPMTENDPEANYFTQVSKNESKLFSFKSFKGFKHIDRIRDFYTIRKDKDLLGAGSFGAVYKTTNKTTLKPAAIKVIEKKKLKGNEVFIQLMRNELFVLEKTDHPHITQVYELLEDNKHFYVVMELLSGGNLLQKISKMKVFGESHTAKIIYQIMLALNYMHKQNVTHRDLKPENIMCSSADENDLNIKLTDFGFACFFNPKEGMDCSLGTPLFMAPELVQGEKYDQRVDVWSLGVITYFLLTTVEPFPGNIDEIKNGIIHKDPVFNAKIWQKKSGRQAQNFVFKCLAKDYNDRPNIQELLEHPWILNWVENSSINEDCQIQISENLIKYQEVGLLQSGVISLLSNLLGSSEDLKECVSIFEHLDSEHDGFIDVVELEKGLKNSKVFLDTDEEEWQTIIKAIDVNGDGKIDFTEFISVAYNRKKLLCEENVKIAFKIFDKDGDGEITKEELKSVFGNGKQFGQEFDEAWKTILAEVDTNGDEKISFDEFSKAMQKELVKGLSENLASKLK